MMKTSQNCDGKKKKPGKNEKRLNETNQTTTKTEINNTVMIQINARRQHDGNMRYEHDRSWDSVTPTRRKTKCRDNNMP